jgi:methionyl aminopeptidase
MFNDHIRLKTSVDVARIRKSCKIAENLLKYLKSFVKEGINTRALDSIAEKFIREQGGTPALKGYKGFPAAICTSVNNVAAHGIPGDYVLSNGDIITIDVTVSVNGWHGDAAWSYLVGEGSPDRRRLLKTAWRSTIAGILAVTSGGHMGDIGYAVSSTAGKYGCSVIPEYVGHGIGQQLHEDPCVPNIGTQGTGLAIVPGLVFTVEPIINLGASTARVIEDGWTIVTEDDCLTAQFEHTVAVFRDRVEILTFSEQNILESLDYPPVF